MSEPLPEVTPEKVSDDIELVLLVTTGDDREGIPFAMVYTDAGHQDPELAARGALSAYGDSYRFAGLVRVRVPRALLKERWKEARR